MYNRNAKKQVNFFVFSRGAPPRKDTTHCIQKHETMNVACFRVAGFRLAMQRHDKLQGKTRQIKSGVYSCGGAKGRHAKTRQSNNFRPATRQKYHRVVVPSPRKHAHTTWHKSATIQSRYSTD